VIYLFAGRNLKAADPGGTSDPFVTAEIVGQKTKVTSKIIKKTVNPVWNEVKVLPCPSKDSQLVLAVFDKDPIFNDFLGDLKVNLGTWPSKRTWEKLSTQGEIQIKLVHKKETPDQIDVKKLGKPSTYETNLKNAMKNAVVAKSFKEAAGLVDQLPNNSIEYIEDDEEFVGLVIKSLQNIAMRPELMKDYASIFLLIPNFSKPEFLKNGGEKALLDIIPLSKNYEDNSKFVSNYFNILAESSSIFQYASVDIIRSLVKLSISSVERNPNDNKLFGNATKLINSLKNEHPTAFDPNTVNELQRVKLQ
jgi:hypothetical protein